MTQHTFFTEWQIAIHGGNLFTKCALFQSYLLASFKWAEFGNDVRLMCTSVACQLQELFFYKSTIFRVRTSGTAIIAVEGVGDCLKWKIQNWLSNAGKLSTISTCLRCCYKLYTFFSTGILTVPHGIKAMISNMHYGLILPLTIAHVSYRSSARVEVCKACWLTGVFYFHCLNLTPDAV